MTAFAPGLAPIAARPPTPPKEKTAKASPNNGFGTTSSTGHVFLATPDESPSSSAEYLKESIGKAQKRVGFTLLGTQYHRFSVDGHESDSDGQIRQLPRSKDCKSSKSILKACADNAGDPSSSELLAFDNTNLPAMLRSTTHHLASASRSSRLDAYSTMLACLGAYDEIPDIQELAEKVAEITGYIRRDITANHGEDGSLDIQLATQALKLVTIFLCTPRVATLFPEDFCSFILERAILGLENQASPKILVSHYMHMLEKQKFSSKHMTNDRVDRLLSALNAVTVWVKGNRVVSHRLMIYQRLLGQAKLLMVSRVASWIDHLVSGMLSTIKDIRARAIAFGADASLQLGTTIPVSQACLDLFNRESAEGVKMVDFLSSRLIEMASSEEDGIHVPQIWSVIIMFLRSRRRQLENWEYIKAWLVVIQRCFNSSDGQTKLQANIAWNRLIFAINLDVSTSIAMAKMLRQPIIPQLEKKSSEKSSKHAKQIARSSYCTLLYYGLRPTATHAQLDQYWDLFICQMLPSCFTISKSDIDHACNILSALFFVNGKSKMWKDNRINDGLINPEDLPCIDPKWIRLRAARIIQVFDTFFDVADWQLSKDGDAPIVLAWRNFTLAVGNAGGKEVKVSMDAMNAVAHIVNEIKLILERSNSRLANERHALPVGVTKEAVQSATFEKIRILLSEAIAKIGNLPFLERRLIRTSQDSFEAADTPSRRSSRDSGSLDSSVAHLLNILLRNGQHASTAASYIAIFKTLVYISLQSATSRRAQLGILRNLGRLLVLDGGHRKESSIVFWGLLADGTSSALKQPQQNEPHNDSPLYPGHDFREAVKILELGIQLRSSSDESAWQELYSNVIDTLRKDVGNEAVGLVVIEPLAGFISKDDYMCDDFVLAAAALMLEAVQWPQSSHLVERVQRRLWGVAHVAPKITSIDPFDKLYSMVEYLLSGSYASVSMLPLGTVVKFVSATSRMIASCPPEYQGTVLSRIQNGLALWIEDAKGILSQRPSSAFRTLYSEVRKLWKQVVNSIEHSVVFDSGFLSSIQELVTAGFRSRHKAVVNESIAMWNNSFGGESTLDYSEDLRIILQKLRSMTELSLPNFPESKNDQVMSSPLHFVDSQDEEDMQLEPVLSPSRLSTSIDSLHRVVQSVKGVPLSPHLNKTAMLQGSPPSARRGVRTTPKARLRHDDSQIQFAAIESSPLQVEPVESQRLTDRQKEVKERQGREAAAMFPEIRSSPRSTSRPIDYMLPELVFKSAHSPTTKAAIIETSPSYLPDALMNDFLGSSPTPSSKRSSAHRSDKDRPSSRPFIPQHFQTSPLTDGLLANEDHAPIQATSNADEVTSNTLADESLPSTKVYSSNGEDIGALKDHPSPNNIQGEGRSLEAPRVPVSFHPVTDSNINVDAPSAPSLDEPWTEREGYQLNDVANSIRSGDSSPFPEEDQVSAQLFTEMERASQQSAKEDKAAQSPREATKKRKCTTNPPNVEKKIKRTTASSDSLPVAKVPRTGEMIADCVMIDVRKVDRLRPMLSQQVKREPFASPSVLTSIQMIEETPIVEKTPGYHTMDLEAHQSSGQEYDAPTTAKKAIGRPRGSRYSQVKQEEMEIEQASPLRKSRRVSERSSGPGTSSPHMSPASSQESTKGGQWFALGKTPRRGMFKWLQRSSAESEDIETVSPKDRTTSERNAKGISEYSGVEVSQRNEVSAANKSPAYQSISQKEDDSEIVTNQGEGEAPAEADVRVEREGEAASAGGILDRFHSMLNQIRGVALAPEEERAVVNVLFDCVKEVHEAGRRHRSM